MRRLLLRIAFVFLAVAPLPSAEPPTGETAAPGNAPRLDATQQPLPYELPE